MDRTGVWGTIRLAFCWLVLVSSYAAAQTPLYRINAGGTQYVDSAGQTWAADQYFNTGQPFNVTNAISGTADDALYQSERWDSAEVPELKYEFPVPSAGSYRVRLHFAETYPPTSVLGGRVFNVKVENQTLLQALDIFKEAGANAALVKNLDLAVIDGKVTIEFTRLVQNPKVNAIEILALGSGGPGNQPPIAAASATPTSGTVPLTVSFSSVGSSDPDGAITSYLWNFGNGQTSTLANPSHTFQVANIYTVTLTVTDNAGATASKSIPITVQTAGSTGTVLYRINAGGPQYVDSTGQTWSPDQYFNTGQTFGVTNAISGTADDALYQSERWDNADLPELKYEFPVAANGAYRVRLHFAETYPPTAVIGGRVFDVRGENQLLLPALDVFKEAGADTALVKSFDLNVTDGKVTIEFSRVVQNPKVNAIEILSLGSGGPGNQPPVAAASATPASGTAPLTVAFSSAGSSDPDGTIASYQWNFGNGQTSTLAYPSHTFQSANTYTVTLTVTDNGGATATKSLTINVTGNQPPVAAASATPTSGTAPLTVAFSSAGSSDPNGSIASYQWNFGNGQTSTLANPSHTFQSANTYTVTLTVTDNGGATATKSLTINVTGNQPPVAAASATPTSGTAPLTVAFSSAGSSDPDGTIASYLWNFGNGQTSTLANPSHTFQSANTYTVTLTVTDNGGAMATKSLTITAQSAGSSGSVLYRINAGGLQFVDSTGQTWSADQYFNTGQTFGVTNAISGTADDALYHSERWDNVDLPELKYEFPVTASGAYRIRLHFAETYPPNSVLGGRVFDVKIENQTLLPALDIFKEAGPNAALVKSLDLMVIDGNVTIEFSRLVQHPKINAIEILSLGTGGPGNQPPVAAASATPASGAAPLTVVFSSAGSSDSDGTIASYLWNFGNGQTSTLANPSHTFQTPNVYTVTLTITDNAGATATKSLTINAQSQTTPGTALYRINAGGAQYTDSTGQIWAADQYFNTGQTYQVTDPIAGTTADALYQVQRWDSPTLPDIKYEFPVGASGLYQVRLHFAEIYSGAMSVGARVFNVLLENQVVLSNLDVFQQAGGYTALVKTFAVSVTDGSLTVAFQHITNNPTVNAIEVIDLAHAPGATQMHVVINAPDYVVDYDGGGTEVVTLDARDSHTHEIGQRLVGFSWTRNGAPAGSTSVITPTLPVGRHTFTLTITDSKTPPETLSGSKVIDVVSAANVPGSLVHYFETSNPASLLNASPSTAHFGQVNSAMMIPVDGGGKLSGTPYTGNVMVRMLAQLAVAAAGTYTFQATGASQSVIYVDGVVSTGSLNLSAGPHQIDVRFAVTQTGAAPLQVTWASGAGAQTAIPAGIITHSEAGLKPVINTIPASGSGGGGETIQITGMGFFPAGQVVVKWGSATISGASLSVTPQTIGFVAPPGSGSISVTVQTPAGVSDPATYSYSGTAPAVSFQVSTLALVAAPTAAEWGPDGRLYVATLNGEIKAYTLDANYQITNTQTINVVAGLTNKQIMGIAFNPFDPPGKTRIYVAHSLLYANGGDCFTEPSPYSGQVSVLEGPSFATVQPLITGLPVSNHDHGIEGLQFDNNGDLLIAVGGNTNAGVPSCPLGGLDESPFSGAVLKARLSKPGFSGAVTYLNNGVANSDQTFGGTVTVAPGVDLQIFASGLRNTWDLVFTTKGLVYATDNGADSSYGASSTSATTQGPDPDEPDQLNLLENGGYYGHPNRNRGRSDARQNVFRSYQAAAIPGIFRQGLTTFASSTNGLVEYRADTFGGSMRGDLLAQKLSGTTYRVTLAPDGKSVVSNVPMPFTMPVLDVTMIPGGAIVGADYYGNAVLLAKPMDSTPNAVFDIFPWRAPKSGGNQFIIAGSGFGNTANTTVTIGGASAALSSVGPTRIVGSVPANPAAPEQLVNVVVTVNGVSRTLPSAFRFISTPGAEPDLGLWQTGPAMPQPLGEVAAGVINGKLYILGEDNSSTFAFDLAHGTWTTVAPRPFLGHHHGAEILNNKLYLIGGLNSGAGKLQIYDPVANTWTLGADMPFAAGSVSTAVIGGQIYAAGGIVDSATVTNTARYNPATNTWTTIAPMPQGRNHAAAATDGVRLFIFGGRGAGSGDGNVVANGFNTVQIYNPASNTWVSSATAGSGLSPLPQARGGMGKAVWRQGEFYVLGGETSTGAGATPVGTYNRVDIYNPASNTWRLGVPMPTARHGIFPLLHGDRIYVVGGGTSAGHSSSTLNEIYAP